MSKINPIAVLISFVALQALGFIWYHESFLGAAWLEDVGLDPASMGAPPPIVWVVMATSTLLKVLILALILRALDVTSWPIGVAWGAFLGFGLLAMTLASHHGFAMNPWRQSIIEGTQEVVGFALAAGILCAGSKKES